jgi:hypothetical protein
MPTVTRRKLTVSLALALVPLGAGFAPVASAAIDLNGINYVQYGDAQSYSLPIACMQVGQAYQGCKYNIDSTPGQIKDLVVIATGAGGKPINENFAGMDDAYSTPNSSGVAFFQTGGTTVGGITYPATDPDQVSVFTGDKPSTWDATVGSLSTFLGNDALVFFFNNNQEKSNGTAAESLAVWAQITVTSADGSTTYGTFDFTNNNGKYALVSEGGGGTVNGDVASYTSNTSGPDGNTTANTDYVLSGGALCVIGTPPLPVSCSTPGASAPIDHNLGADHAAYAILFPELNALLAQLIAAGNLTAVMHVDFRMGCDPTLFGTNKDAVICTGTDNGFGKALNNGYEQLFIGRAVQPPKPPVVPAPGSLALIAGGLLAAGVSLRRRKDKAAA